LISGAELGRREIRKIELDVIPKAFSTNFNLKKEKV